MTLNAVAYNSLCSEEVRIIESMRRFSKTDVSFCLKPRSDQYVDLIDNSMNQFLLILWKHDPSALDLCKQNDIEVSIFELQLLYCIEKCRAGHRKTVDDLLSWWFPVSAEKISNMLINSIAETLNKISMASSTEDRLLSQILSLMLKKKSKPKLYLIEGGRSSSSFNFEVGGKNDEK
ncbi:MAG: hypothetical protein OSA23_08135 [Rhodospirillales bacterium]|nr:hypothetical protein [Rhodospirillales bacterium]